MQPAIKTFLIFILSFIQFINCSAQITFQEEIYSPEDMRGSGLTLLADSSIIIFSIPLMPMNPDYFYLTKTDAAGNVLWHKIDSSPSSSRPLIAVQFLKTSDGNFILGGQISVNGTVGSTLIKMDTAGNVIWNKTYPKTQPSQNSFKETNDRGFILSLRMADTVISAVQYNKLIMKTDSVGNILWSKMFPMDTILRDYLIIETDDGGYLYSSGVVTAKLDANGNVVRSFSFGSRPFFGQGFFDLIRINSNAYQMVNGRHLTLIDSASNILWDKQLSPPGSEYVDGARLNDSTFVLLENKLVLFPGMSVEKIDTSGTFIAETHYDIWSDIAGGALEPLADGSILLAGSVKYGAWHPLSLFLMNTNSEASTDCGVSTSTYQLVAFSDTLLSYSLTNLDGNPYSISDSNLSIPISQSGIRTICSAITDVPADAFPKRGFEIFPNPAKDNFTVILNRKNTNTKMEIFDLFGVCVYSTEIPGEQQIIKKQLTSGIYLVQIISADERFLQKLIIE